MVLKEIPDGCTVVGIPGTIVKRSKPTNEDLNQVDLPDPIAVEMECLRRRVVMLENKLREREKGSQMKIYNTLTRKKRRICADR